MIAGPASSARTCLDIAIAFLTGWMQFHRLKAIGPTLVPASGD
jgi:hypothetical protein